jgi:chromosome segregation ATPase
MHVCVCVCVCVNVFVCRYCSLQETHLVSLNADSAAKERMLLERQRELDDLLSKEVLWNERMSLLQDRWTSQQEAYTTMKQKLATQTEDLQTMEHRHASLIVECRELEKNASGHPQQLDLTVQRDQMMVDIQHLRHQHVDLLQQFETAQREMLELQQANAKRKAEHDAVVLQLSHRQADLDIVMERFQTVQADVRATEQRHTALNDQLLTVEQQLNAQRKAKSEATDAVFYLQQQHTQLIADRESLEQQLADMALHKSQLHQSQQELQHECNRLQENITVLKQTHHEVQTAMDDSAQRLASQQTTWALSTEHSRLVSANTALQSEIADQQTRLQLVRVWYCKDLTCEVCVACNSR